MASSRAPLWALTAGAVDGAGDTHLPKGIHVRVLPAPRLGVPATPLAVYRIQIGPDTIKRLSRSDGVVWVDANGHPRAVPFQVTPDIPVYGYFPEPDVIYAELSAKPAQAAEPVVAAPPQLSEVLHSLRPLPSPTLRPIQPMQPVQPRLRPPKPAATQPQPAVGPSIGRFARPLDVSTFIKDANTVLKSQQVRHSSLRFEALTNSPLGPAPFQTRSNPPYVLAAGRIPLVRVVGSGTVEGIRWLAAGADEKIQASLWELWSLPVKPAPRYWPTPNAIDEAEARVARAAVTRWPLHIAFGVTSPGAAPPATPDDGLKRLDQVRGEVDRWLDRLLHDTSRPIWELTDSQVIQAGAGGRAELPIEPFLLSGAVDPDLAHYLGFGDVDQKLEAAPGSLVVYQVRGLWRWEPERWHATEQRAFAGAVRGDAGEALKEFPELAKADLKLEEKGPFIDLHQLAVAVVGVPSDPPLPVRFDPPEDRGWLATPPPPNVRRALRLTAGGFPPLALAALAATDAGGDRSLNPYPGVGRHAFGQDAPKSLPLPLIVSRPQEATRPGEARFEDRDAPEGPIHYRLAPGDWFGRWGGWSTADAPAKARTRPMRPTIELYPQPPVLPNPVPASPLAGSLTLRIPIPNTEDLPAGGAALQQLELDETFGASPATHLTYTLPAPAGATIMPDEEGGHDVLVIVRPGPALAPAAQSTVLYTARWRDVEGQVSADSDPAKRTITDPRPPPAPAVATELRYTSRPDAAGHARVDLDFASTPGGRYRVFASTETTLLQALENRGQTAVAAAIRAAAPGAPRAMALRAHQALFGWDDFECVTPESIVADSDTTHFVHRVSGSLEVLAVYRVLSEGPTGALSEMTEAELVPFAVPNLGGPARPQIALVNAGLDPTTQGVRLAVKVPVGKATPQAWRLRRASVPVSDPLRMAVVAEGPIVDATTDAESTRFEIDAPAPLKPWRQYRFAVEVQAGPPPGAPTAGVIPAGEWGEASAPATLAVIPPAAPEAPSDVQIVNTATALQITLTHPAADTLIGTALGPHRFEVWLCPPDERPTRLELPFARGDGSTWTAEHAPPAPAGSYVSVRIIDPVGRRSDARTSNVI